MHVRNTESFGKLDIVSTVLKGVNYPVHVFIGDYRDAIIGTSVPPILFFFFCDVLLVLEEIGTVSICSE